MAFAVGGVIPRSISNIRIHVSCRLLPDGPISSTANLGVEPSFTFLQSNGKWCLCLLSILLVGTNGHFAGVRHQPFRKAFLAHRGHHLASVQAAQLQYGSIDGLLIRQREYSSGASG